MEGWLLFLIGVLVVLGCGAWICDQIARAPVSDLHADDSHGEGNVR